MNAHHWNCHLSRWVRSQASGFYENDFWKKRYPRVQVLTVLEVLNGKRPDMPWGGSPFAKAPVEREKAETERLL